MKTYLPKSVLDRYDACCKLAKSLRKIYQSGRTFHITVAIYKRKVLAVGINNYSRIVFRTKLGTYKRDGNIDYVPNMHSEVAALLKLARADCSNLEFYNVRVDRNDIIRSSIPCYNCMCLLKQVGYKRIIYVNSNGNLEVRMPKTNVATKENVGNMSL